MSTLARVHLSATARSPELRLRAPKRAAHWAVHCLRGRAFARLLACVPWALSPRALRTLRARRLHEAVTRTRRLCRSLPELEAYRARNQKLYLVTLVTYLVVCADRHTGGAYKKTFQKLNQVLGRI